ncbi:MAG: hypothetical protein Q7U56_05070 [Humidesulfovibrio sp.]|nr:hypothetical protein [Desulfovibrio sp.]MDO9082634.1 hypothetical protein [Humidesulfovibrio sp.]
MSLAHLIKHVVDSLWAVGGIGAAAELGLEDIHQAWTPKRRAGIPLGLAGVRGGRRLPKPLTPGMPLEGELCRTCCPNCCSRPLSR